jgi:hypothetical protein
MRLDGVPVTTWDTSFFSSGGHFELDGRRYQVKSNMTGSKYAMTDETGTVFAEAERVGRKRWRVHAGSRTYEFKRGSMWKNDQQLMDGDTPIGRIHSTSTWRGSSEADLPGLPLPVQIFVHGVVITMWNAQSAAAASSAS